MNFEKAFAVLMSPDIEGGYSIQKWDDGGETKYGISKRSYPNVDILSLTLDEASKIYKRDFWDPLRLDEMLWIFALPVFDSAVNQGPKPAVRLLQRSLGLQEDGVIGSQTLRVAAGCIDKHLTLADYMSRRMARYSEHPDWPVAKRGWARRLFLIQTWALLEK